jgi:hypothetical protein
MFRFASYIQNFTTSKSVALNLKFFVFPPFRHLSAYGIKLSKWCVYFPTVVRDGLYSTKQKQFLTALVCILLSRLVSVAKNVRCFLSRFINDALDTSKVLTAISECGAVGATVLLRTPQILHDLTQVRTSAGAIDTSNNRFPARCG